MIRSYICPIASFFSYQNQKELDKTVDGNSIFWDWKGDSEQNIEENDPNEIIVHKTEVGIHAGELNLIQDGNSILVTWSGPELEKIVDGNSIHWSWSGIQQVRILFLIDYLKFLNKYLRTINKSDYPIYLEHK